MAEEGNQIAFENMGQTIIQRLVGHAPSDG
jgi:hypothetical protein